MARNRFPRLQNPPLSNGDGSMLRIPTPGEDAGLLHSLATVHPQSVSKPLKEGQPLFQRIKERKTIVFSGVQVSPSVRSKWTPEAI